MRQDNGINQIVEFIRKNALALEKGSNRPVINSKGEWFLQVLIKTTSRSNSGLGVA